MRLKPPTRRVAIVDEHIPDTKCTPPRVHSTKNVENGTTGGKSADLSSNHKRCQHHIHQQQTTTQKRTQRDEALTHISVQLPTLPLNTACMRVKVDTGAQGNVLPLRVFSCMFPEYMDNNIPQVSVL